MLTITDAARRTGKSTSTIRRFVKTVVQAHNHVDRLLIDPSPEDVRHFIDSGVQFSWKISEQLLDRAFPDDNTQTADSTAGETAPFRSDDFRQLIEMLKEQLLVKDQQLGAKDSQIADITQRLGETNILLRGLQECLSLPAASQPQESVSKRSESRKAATATSRVRRKPTPKPAQKKAPVPAKQSKTDATAKRRGFFRFLRHTK